MVQDKDKQWQWLKEQLGLGNEPDAPFTPQVVMDLQLVQTAYLTEDVSYVRESIDDLLDLLWHPEEPRVIGVILLMYDPTATIASIADCLAVRLERACTDRVRTSYQQAITLLTTRAS